MNPLYRKGVTLLFFDMPTTVNQLQAYWIDYEVWYRETSAFVYRNWEKKYIVMPPFTNHSDNPEGNCQNHGNHFEPSYNDCSGFTTSINIDPEEDETIETD